MKKTNSFVGRESIALGLYNSHKGSGYQESSIRYAFEEEVINFFSFRIYVSDYLYLC